MAGINNQEVNSIFDYIFPRKKATDYQQTNLLDYAEDPLGINVYNPGQGDFGVMTLEGLKNSIPASLASTLDTGIQASQYLRQGKPPVRQINENVEPSDFNIYNQYQSTEPRPFTKAYQKAGIINTDEEIKAFRERSAGFDTGNLLGQIAGQGMAFKTLTGNAFRDWINFAMPFANIDPISEPNIAQIAQQMGADNDFINYMAGNVDENSDAEAILAQKMKNITSEGLLLNLPIDGVISLLRSMKSSYPQVKQYLQDPEYRGLVHQDIKEKTADTIVDTLGNQDVFAGVRSLFGQTDNQFGTPITRQNLPWSLSSTGEGDFYIKRHGANAGTPSKERTSPNDIAVKVDPNVLLPDYAYYMFQYLQPKMANRAHGSVQQAINFRDVNDTLIEHLTGQGATTPGTKLFGGTGAVDADLDMLDLAKKRYREKNLTDINSISQREGRDEVWKETGWAMDRNGKWYFEVDDSKATIPDNVNTRIADSVNQKEDYTYSYMLEDAFNHPELFRQYPEFKYYHLSFKKGEVNPDTGEIVHADGSHAYASPEIDTITIPYAEGKLDQDVRKTILHEIQHLIQSRERFMNGGEASLGFSITLRDQLYKEMKAKADNPDAFMQLANLRRLMDYKDQMPVYQKIYSKIYLGKVPEAIQLLKSTDWWVREGAEWERRIRNKFEKNNLGDMYAPENAQQLRSELLSGEANIQTIVELYDADIDNIYYSFGKYKGYTDDEIHQNWDKVKKEVEDELDGLNKYSDGTTAGNKRVLDDALMRSFGVKDEKTKKYYTNKFRMLNDVEKGIYRGNVMRRKVYDSLTGESQARLVERRADLTPEERQARFPEIEQEFGTTARVDKFGVYSEANRPIYVDRPKEFEKRKKTQDMGVLKLVDDEPTRELAPLDEGGYFMKSAQVLMDDPREIYKQPSLLAQVNKKGEIVGELVNKGVKVDELKETGLLGYLNTKQHLGEPVTKQELLDFIETNRPKIEPHISFHSDAFGSDIEIPAITDVRNFHYDVDTGGISDVSTGRNVDVNDSNFKILKPEDDSSFDIKEETEYFRKDFTYADFPLDLPNQKSLSRDDALIIFLKELGFDAGFLNRQKFKKFVKDIRRDEFERNVPRSQQKSVGRMEHLIREEFNISESDYNNALEQIATKIYYQNPTVQWDVPVKTDKGTLEYKVFSRPFASTGYGGDYVVKVKRPGHEYFEDVGYVTNFNDISVKIRDNVGFILGRSDDSPDTLLGTNWGQYVQGNTNMDTYREIAVNLNQQNYRHPDIKFHAMAGKTSADTRNMFGHLRIDNRVDKQGRKHTHSGEHQSDLAQKAREYGVTDAEHKTKRENADIVLDKALEDKEEVTKLKNDAWKYADKQSLKHSLYDSTEEITEEFLNSIIGNSVKFQDLIGLKIDKPMIDQYIARLKKFVVDEGMDDEVGVYHVMDNETGEIEKRILNKASILKTNIKKIYDVLDIRNPEIKYPTVDEVVQRFKNGNPNYVDIEIAQLTGQDIQTFFSDAVNHGGAEMGKLDTFKKVMGSEEVFDHQGKVVTYQQLNQLISRKLHHNRNAKSKKDVQDFAKSKGVKGSLYKLDSKINRNVEKAKVRRNRLYDFGRGIGGTRPPLIHKDRHTKLLLKELIKQGIKDGSDVVSWTPAINQIELWGEEQASMFKKLYDKDSKKFGNEILKDLGLNQQVQTKGATIDYGTMKPYNGDPIHQGERDVMYIELTPELKKAVLNEEPDKIVTHDPSYNDTSFRQPLYAVPPIGLIGMPSEDNGRIDTNKGLLQ